MAAPSGAAPAFLHLAPDDKFIPFIRKLYEAAFPGRSRFRILTSGATPRYVALDECTKRARIPYWFSAQMRRELEACDCLVVHFMNPLFAKAVLAAPARVLVVWGAWGGDYYHLLAPRPDAYLLAETARLVAATRARGAGPLGGAIRGGFGMLLRAGLLPRWERDALPRVDVATMLPVEHRMLRAAQPAFRARYHQLHYYSAEDIFAKGPDSVEGADILVGNSATPENNHVEAFSLLRSLPLGGRRIVVPLGYGYPRYAEAVCRAGEAAFGERFMPLRGFIPLEEFNRRLAGCSIAVMNHVRQQAFGTINTALFKGAKVFLRAENPLLSFYRDLGITVFELADAPVATDFFAPLAESERKANRQALIAYTSFESAVAAVRALAPMVAAKSAEVPRV